MKGQASLVDLGQCSFQEDQQNPLQLTHQLCPEEKGGRCHSFCRAATGRGVWECWGQHHPTTQSPGKKHKTKQFSNCHLCQAWALPLHYTIMCKYKFKLFILPSVLSYELGCFVFFCWKGDRPTFKKKRLTPVRHLPSFTWSSFSSEKVMDESLYSFFNKYSFTRKFKALFSSGRIGSWGREEQGRSRQCSHKGLKGHIRSFFTHFTRKEKLESL